MVELWRDFIDNDDTDEDLEEVELNEYHFVLEQMCDAAGGESSGCGSTCEGGSCSSTGPWLHGPALTTSTPRKVSATGASSAGA